MSSGSQWWVPLAGEGGNDKKKTLFMDKTKQRREKNVPGRPNDILFGSIKMRRGVHIHHMTMW